MTKQLKRILLDSIGVLLIVISPFLGPLPGPGGLPVFLTGLWLLSLNHEWAHKLLNQVKELISNAAHQKFLRKPAVILGLDITASLLAVLSIYLIETRHEVFAVSLAWASLTAALAIFCFNRFRLKRFLQWIKRKGN